MNKLRIAAVQEFHHGIWTRHVSKTPVAQISGEDRNEAKRLNLMAEENEEYLEAAQRTTIWLRLQMLWEICCTFYVAQS